MASDANDRRAELEAKLYAATKREAIAAMPIARAICACVTDNENPTASADPLCGACGGTGKVEEESC